MTRQEKKILDMLNEATQDVKVPESLEPEQIEKLLENRKVKRWKRGYTYSLAAACTAVLVGVGFFAGSLGTKPQTDKNNTSLAQQEERGTENLPISESLAKAESYDEILEYLNAYDEYINREIYSFDGGFTAGAENGEIVMEDSEGAGVSTDSAADMAAPMARTEEQKFEATAEGAGADFSDTNVRTEGVGEADIVKTDGKYLYVKKENGEEISIVDTSEDQMNVVSTIQIPGESKRVQEFYISGKKLFVLMTLDVEKLDKNGQMLYETDTRLVTYDLADIKAPELKGTLTQSGSYQSSRFVDGYLYIFSNYYVYGNHTIDDRDYIVPLVNDKVMEADSIYLPPIRSANQYLVAVSVNAEKPDEVVDQKAVLSEGGSCYVSGNNIYIYERTWCDNPFVRTSLSTVNRTVIRKISYKDGKLNGEAQGKVNGWLNDSFSIDEYDGNLRVVATVDGAVETTNAVYVLDKDLNVIGEIKDLAEGERVYSARMLGKTGYFVTYRETDPLFSVDFSDPENPKIIGDLKIPGFSEYLHFYGENQLLGIGMDTDEESGVTNGVKISMFDISDPSDVKEVQKYVIPDAYYAQVFNDYRAVMIDHNKNIIGFDVSAYNEMYYIFSYDATNGFNLEMKEEINGRSYDGTRGLYINDKIYVVNGNVIESYRMGSYEKVDDLLL
ncbi:MAG: hypothetical protein HFG41_14245 [Coprococcus sp.]|nr:hypothetical protein [Coprococcus sp.]